MERIRSASCASTGRIIQASSGGMLEAALLERWRRSLADQAQRQVEDATQKALCASCLGACIQRGLHGRDRLHGTTEPELHLGEGSPSSGLALPIAQGCESITGLSIGWLGLGPRP